VFIGHAASAPNEQARALIAALCPSRQHAVDLRADLVAGVPAFKAARQELLIARLVVTHVRRDRRAHRLLVETFRSRRSSHASTLLAGVRRDLLRPIRRATRIQVTDAFDEPRHELGIQFRTPLRLAVAARCPCLCIVEALRFGALERCSSTSNPWRS